MQTRGDTRFLECKMSSVARAETDGLDLQSKLSIKKRNYIFFLQTSVICDHVHTYKNKI